MPYLVNNLITVRWILRRTATPLLASDYDILLITGDQNGAYTDDAISNYTAPTPNTSGELEYSFTPIVPGIFRLYLTTNEGAGGGGGGTGSWANGDQTGTIFFTINSGGGFQIGETVGTLSPFRFDVMTVDANVTGTSFDFISGGTYEVQVGDTLFGQSSETNATVDVINVGGPGGFIVLSERYFYVQSVLPIFTSNQTPIGAPAIVFP